jgi:Fe-S cluster assembly protein SufD
MSTFTESAHAFVESHPDELRRAAWHAYSELGLPTTVDEVWRYAPLAQFALDSYALSGASDEPALAPVAGDLAQHAGVVVRVVNGRLVSVRGSAAGLEISTIDATANETLTRYGSDAFALLNSALAPHTLVITVAPKTSVEKPIVILSSVTAGANFPSVRIELGASSSARIVEYIDGGDNALVVPLSEYLVGDNASLQLTTYQCLSTSAWHVARTTTFLERDARMRQSVISLGGHYNRSRNDSEVLGTGALNELRTTYLGSGDQVHDFRTRQFHRVGRSNSVLLSKGAVADRARSIYTGLIEIEKGAKRTDARQTNHNLLLSPHAHADSVPNLDIRENDVVCAHASSVGPLDELQRWYLESRGVSRHDAERLMIQGFFYEMLSSLGPELAGVVEADLATTLAALNVVTP